MLTLVLVAFVHFALTSAASPSTEISKIGSILQQARVYVAESAPAPQEFLKQLQTVRNEVDNLFKTLSSRTPLIETPCAFQWAQNATHVLLHVKFTRRWNAPGALEVKNLQVDFTPEGVRMSGEGEHSGHRYLYTLGLNVFSEISPEISRHNFASVGRLMIHMPKKFPGIRWPRLLADGNLKFDNMHFWMDMHNKFSDQLEKSAKLVAHSPLTCSIYCPISDSCISDCSVDCPKKPITAGRICVGPPTETPAVIGNFADLDPEISFLRGELRVNATALSPEISGVRAFFGNSQKQKLGSEIASVSDVESDGNFLLNISAFIPSETPTQFLLAFFNVHGESENFASVAFRDFVAPPKPENLEISSGTAVISLVSDFAKHSITSISLVFGKSDGCVRSKTISANITIPSNTSSVSYTLPSGLRAPLSSTHILAFARTSLGDSVDCALFPLHASVRAAPKLRPLSVAFDGRSISVVPGLSDDDAPSVESFAVYEHKGTNSRARLLGRVLLSSGPLQLKTEEADANAVARVCVFAANYLGEAEEGECADNSQKTKSKTEL